MKYFCPGSTEKEILREKEIKNEFIEYKVGGESLVWHFNA